MHPIQIAAYCFVRVDSIQTKQSTSRHMSKHVESHVQAGLELLWQVKLALLLETCACVALTQGLEGRPVSCELLRDTALGRDDGLRGLLATVLAPCAPRPGCDQFTTSKI